MITPRISNAFILFALRALIIGSSKMAHLYGGGMKSHLHAYGALEMVCLLNEQKLSAIFADAENPWTVGSGKTIIW
jgi:hypothetical protein